jgi:hypothetical protein
MKRVSFFTQEMFTRVPWVVIAISAFYIIINHFVSGSAGLPVRLYNEPELVNRQFSDAARVNLHHLEESFKA